MDRKTIRISIFEFRFFSLVFSLVSLRRKLRKFDKMMGRYLFGIRTLFLIGTLMGALGWFHDLSAQWLVGANLAVAVPVDEFNEVADPGMGIELRGQYRLRNVPYVSLRSDVTFITYQYEWYIVQTEFWNYRVETRTQSVRVTLGPQFSVRTGRIELYVSPQYGIYNFNTHEDIPYTLYSRSRGNNTEFGGNIKGGVTIGVYRMPERNFDLALDVGGAWHSVRNGISLEIEGDEGPVEVIRDVKEVCVHVGIVLLFR